MAIIPTPGGDLLRDGSGVLPTGRNIHALDPIGCPRQVHTKGQSDRAANPRQI